MTLSLSYYTKRVTAKVLNSCSNLTAHYTTDSIKGVFLVDGIATVKVVVDGGKVAYLPFNAEQFKTVVESVRRDVLAAISTEQAWARRHSVTLSHAVTAVTQAVTAINSQAVIRRAVAGQR